jgi:hypothetical protein
MIYPISLKLAGIVVGLVLIALHVVAVLQPAACEKWLKGFPRSRVAGTILIAIATIWSFLLIRSMDLGEFVGLRNPMLIAIAVSGFLAWKYLEEFLAVRALGMIALLVAEPVLGAAFLRDEPTRLLVVVLAYVWIILGLFWVGMPWVLRDQIAWLTAQRKRLSLAAWAGVAYGAAVLICAAALWK